MDVHVVLAGGEELFPDLDKADWPAYQEVTKDSVYLLTSKNALPLKPMSVSSIVKAPA